MCVKSAQFHTTIDIEPNHTMNKIPLTLLLTFLFSTTSFNSLANDEKLEEITVPSQTSTASIEEPEYYHRISEEEKQELNPYVLTPHKMTYILPVSYSNNMNTEVYDEIGQ